MKAAPGLHIEWVEDEAVVLDPDTGHMHYLNPPAAFVYALIQEYGYDGAVERIQQQFEVEAGIRSQLDSLVEEMRSKGLLVDGEDA